MRLVPQIALIIAVCSGQIRQCSSFVLANFHLKPNSNFPTTSNIIIMSEASSPCCPPGSWEGTLDVNGPSPPKGSFVTMDEANNTVKAYYASPSNKESTFGVIVFHDVWGHLPRLLSICDALAEQGGFHVMAPDVFRSKTKDDVEDMLAWLKEYPYDEVVAKDIDACMQYLKTKHNVTSFGAVG